jgi:hypothetical protein
MTTTYHLTTVDNEHFDFKLSDLRHIECTKDDKGEDVFILHLKSTGKEYMVDGLDDHIRHEMAGIMRHVTHH